MPRTSAGRALARDLLVAYVAAWAVGILYGFLIRVTSTWDEGAAWERNMLRWLHQWKLPSWLESRRFEIEALLPNIRTPMEIPGPNA